MSAPERLSDAEARELLAAYKAGARDRTLDWVKALVLRAIYRLGTPTYRTLGYELHRRGSLALVALVNRHAPFTEPMEDDYEPAGEETR